MNLIKRHRWVICYLIVIGLFSIVYALIGYDAFKTDNKLQIYDWIYFSIVTITTLGYGDITPISFISKLLVSIESLLGLFLLGMFLNGEAQNAIDKKNKKYSSQAICRAMRMIEFMDEHFTAALGYKTDQNIPIKERFDSMAENLHSQPEKFNFNEVILDNIFWGARHAVNDFKLVASESKNLSDGAFSNVSTIITSLETIEESPIDDVSPIVRPRGPESMQHKARIAFMNAAILSSLLNKQDITSVSI